MEGPMIGTSIKNLQDMSQTQYNAGQNMHYNKDIMRLIIHFKLNMRHILIAIIMQVILNLINNKQDNNIRDI